MYQLIYYYTDTMINQKQASSNRKRIVELRRQQDKLEEKLLKRRDMIRASLVKRFLGTREEKRKKPYWYLSRAIAGKTILRYVRFSDLWKVSKKTKAWKDFSSTLAEWVKVTRHLEKLLRQLGEMQSEEYKPEQERKVRR